MPMKDYVYHGKAYGVDADITDPGPYKILGHGQCELPDGKPGSLTGSHAGYSMEGGLSHGPCATSVIALPEKDGCFRTEVRSVVHNLTVDGKHSLSIERIEFGMVSVYKRAWFDRPGWHGRRTRVLPMDCSFVNATLDGEPLALPLPEPFLYSADQRESYLAADEPDEKIDSAVRDAIVNSPTRHRVIPNFGRIFFCEWTLFPNQLWHPVHKIQMLRMAFSSPPSGGGSGGGGEGDGTGG